MKRRAAVLIALGLLAGAAAAQGDRVAYFVRKMDSAGFKVRLQAAFILGRLRDARALPALAKALTDPHYAVRAAAALALGRIRDARATDPLLNALGDPEPWVRAEAVRALGLIRSRKALPQLVARLKDHDWKVRIEAARGLGQILDPRAVMPLAAIVEQQLASADLINAARRSLVRLAGVIKVEELLTQLRTAKQKRVRARAAVILGTLGAKEAVAALVSCLADGESYVRGHCALALANIGDGAALGPLEQHLARETDQRVKRITKLSIAYLRRRVRAAQSK